MAPKATQVTGIGQYDLARPKFESERNKEYNKLIVTGKIGKVRWCSGRFDNKLVCIIVRIILCTQ